MKENTFDVPAYKFFAWKIDDGQVSHTLDDYKFLFDNDGSMISIPFENIDGLKVVEVQTLLSTSEIVISGGSYYSLNYGKNGTFGKFDIVNLFYFHSDYLNEHREETIDKLLEKLMEREYVSIDESIKRMHRCFFERYQDGSYEKTKERIKKLEMRK